MCCSKPARVSIDLTEVRTHMAALDGVVGVHDLHAWTITSGLPVLSAHVVVDPVVLANGRSAAMLDALQACLQGHFDVAHSTFQLEPASHAATSHPCAPEAAGTAQAGRQCASRLI